VCVCVQNPVFCTKYMNGLLENDIIISFQFCEISLDLWKIAPDIFFLFDWCVIVFFCVLLCCFCFFVCVACVCYL